MILFFSHLQNVILLSSGPSCFLMRNLYSFTSLFPLYLWWVFPFVFSFINTLIICLGMDFFVFILFGIWWASWICTFTSFTKFRRKFSVIMLKYFSCTELFCLPGGLVALILDHFDNVSQVSEVLFVVFNHFSPSVIQIG